MRAPGVLLVQLGTPDVAVSSGSACTQATPEPSHVLLAIGLDWAASQECIRFSVGRPTTEELRHDLRTIMETRSDYRYEAYTTPEVRQIRIPQQEWANGSPPLGANGLPVAQGVVRWFDLNAGVGMIVRAGSGDEVFFHFTALPGQGYRTIKPGVPVKFEMVESRNGLTARNIQRIEEADALIQNDGRPRDNT